MSVAEIIAAIAELPEGERRKVYAELDALRSTDLAASAPETPSAHDRAMGLIGPGSGAGDLSSNKAHLRGFGERSRS